MGDNVQAGSIAKAVEIANVLRTEEGLPLLDDLPRSNPKDPQSCLLANAFAFNVSVNTSGGQWNATFPARHEAQAKRLAELLGTYVEPVDYTNTVRVPLSEEIADIAKRFDAGQLPVRYYN